LFFFLILIQTGFVKVFSQYTFEWSHTYGGDAWDEALSMVDDNRGNMVLCGYTKAQEKHLWIVKIDEKGNTIWGKTFKGSPVSEGKDIIISSDSNIMVTGYIIKPYAYSSDFWLLKLNPEGEKIWDKNYGGAGDEKAKGLTETFDKGFVLVGVSNYNPDNGDDAWIIKVDSNGEKIWEKSFGARDIDYANDVIQTSDKGIAVCGMNSSRGGNYNAFWVAKMDSSGTVLWDNIYQVNKWDEATALVEGLDGFIYVTGFTRTVSVIDHDVVLLKLDQEGNLIWQKVISWGRWDQAMSICSTFDNSIIVSGYSSSGEILSSDFAATKFDENGNVLWENIFVRNSQEYCNKVIETRDNGIAMSGTTYSQGRGWDFAVLKFKNNDLPTIHFDKDSVSTSITENYTLQACISTKSNLKNIQVFFNEELFLDEFKRTAEPSNDCDIPLKAELKLIKGNNKIKIVLTDYKGHQTIEENKVYFIPPTGESW